MSRPRRPFFVTITTVGVFLLGMWNAWRVWILTKQSRLLIELGVNLNPYARLVMALIWSALFLALAVALWKRHTIVRRLLPIALFLYALYRLLLFVFFMSARAAKQGWQTDVMLLTIATVWSIWVMHRPAYSDYWQKREDESDDH